MRPVQSARRHRALAAILISLAGVNAVPLRAEAAPPAATTTPAKPAAAAKKPAKPGDKSEDPKRAEARKAYAEAEAKFQAGDYQAAYAAYKTANDAVPAPMTLYKMALSLDKLDRQPEAIAGYDAFLSSSPPASLDAKVAEVRTRVADLRAKAPVVIRVVSDPVGASVALDGASQTGVTPLELKTTPGQHVVRITAPGFDPYERPLELQPGAADTTVEATLTRTPPPPPPPPPAPPVAVTPPPAPPAETRPKTAAYVVLGVAGAGAVVGTIFGVKALSDKSDFDNGMNTADKADSVEKNALIADMAFGAAITLGVTGIVLLATKGTPTDRAAAPRQQAFQFAPVFTPHRAGAAATFQF